MKPAMTNHTIRVIASTARYNVIMTWRFFSWMGFALRFATPLMTLGAAWILFNYVYKGIISAEFGTAIGSSGYLSFITIGNAFYVFTFAAAFVVGRVMFWERATGTIEATFMTPMSRLAYMAGIMLAAAINALVDFIAVFLIGLAFGFQITQFNTLLFVEGLLLTYFALFGIGLIANAITLTFRDRVTTANTLQVLFMVFSGIVCPIEFMPVWAQLIGKALPLTYGIRLTRASMLNIGTADAPNDILMLILLGVVYFAVGAITLRLIERNLKKKALFSVF
jgi:ABC-2 type transport system permease protein